MSDDTPAPEVDARWAAPADVDVPTALLGAQTDAEIAHLLPPWATLPRAFHGLSDPWCDVVIRWFYRGVPGTLLRARAVIDRRNACAHHSAVMRSFVPRHEAKISGVAWLCSLWFETPTSEAATALRADDASEECDER